MNQERRGLIKGLLAAVAFGLSAPLLSTATKTGSPLALAGLLYAGAAIALLLAKTVLNQSSQESSVKKQDFCKLALLTIIGGILAPICLIRGLSLLSTGSASLLLNLETIFTMGLAVAIGREHLSGKSLAAAGLILGGAVIIAGGTGTGTTLGGSLLIAAACLGWGIDNNISQRLSIRDPLQVALIKSIGAAVPMLLLAVLTGSKSPPTLQIISILLIGAFGYGFSIWLDLLALRELGAARESLIFATAPFVGAGFSVVALREVAGPNFYAAGLLMIGGIALMLREDHGHRHTHADTWHEHRHLHSVDDGDPHHAHVHSNDSKEEIKKDKTLWHSHPHQHQPITHSHRHGSDEHHRHPH